MIMAAPKFSMGDRVRVFVNGRVRRGHVSQVQTGHKRGERRLYLVAADTDGSGLGTYISTELMPR